MKNFYVTKYATKSKKDIRQEGEIERRDKDFERTDKV